MATYLAVELIKGFPSAAYFEEHKWKLLKLDENYRQLWGLYQMAFSAIIVTIDLFMNS